MKISIIIPCYNEEESIGSVIQSLPKQASEIIVVDNNSTDRTARIAKSLGAKIVEQPIKGYGRALKTGFAHARGDILVTFDGDGQHPANKIMEMVQHLITHDLDFVSGNRFPQGLREISLIRILGNRFLTSVGNTLFGLQIKDSQCGMWIFKKRVLDEIVLENDDMALSHEIKIKLFGHPRFRAQEYPISFHDRMGTSKLSILGHGFKNLSLLLRLKFSPKPNQAKRNIGLILGVKGLGDGFHDNSAVLLNSGEILFAASEERYSRVKHDGSFPALALKAGLRYKQRSLDDIEMIAVGYPRSSLYSLLLNRYWYDSLVTLGWLLLVRNIFFIQDSIHVLHARAKQKKNGIKMFPELTHKPIIYVDHHIAHAASAYYTSGFDTCFVIVLDAFGPDAKGRLRCGALYIGQKGVLKEIMSIPLWASLGLFYQAVTLTLGFKPGDGEGKTMGLAAYGNPSKVYQALRPFAPHFSNGKWQRGKHWADALFSSQWDYSQLFYQTVLGRHLKVLLTNEKREDIAAATQQILEEEFVNIIRYLCKQYPSIKHVALAGGVFLNVKGNKKILAFPSIKEVFVHPHAGDGGTALGAALVAAIKHGESLMPKLLTSGGLGESFTDQTILKALKTFSDNIRYKKQDDIAYYAANELVAGKVIGWFQGQAEWGPRALGFRSVLADPRNNRVKNRINHVLKNREWFMPFAPSVLQEHASQYFSNCQHSPFMTMVYDVIPGKEKEISAAIHIDNTARPNTVSKEQNPLYYDLITAFYKKTGVPVILNTSFNRHGLPIVNQPKDAIEHLLWGAVDELIIGEYAVVRKQ